MSHYRINPLDKHMRSDLVPLSAALPVTAVAALQRHAFAARGALADATVRALRADSAIYTGWCASVGAQALPGSPEAVAAFVDAMGEAKAPATVRRYVASIGHLHRAAELPDPTKQEAVRLALRRVGRAKGTRQRQAAGITQAIAGQILDALSGSPKDCRDRALLLVGRDLLARRSELVALNVTDVTFADDGTATVLIARSKTDQAGEGAVRLLGPGATAAVRGWLAGRHGVDGAAPLFVALSRAGRPGDRLQAGDVARILKRMTKRAGIESNHVSGHSMRVGMAQDLTAHGLDLAAICQAGRWKTAAMPARYSEHLQAKRGAIAKFYGLR